MTHTQERVRRPKSSPACACGLSGHLSALIILGGHMGYEIIQRLLFCRFPRSGDRKGTALTVSSIGLVPVSDSTHAVLGTMHGIIVHDHQVCPPRGDTLTCHSAKQTLVPSSKVLPPGGPRLHANGPAEAEVMPTAPHGGQATKHHRYKTRDGGDGHHQASPYLHRGDREKADDGIPPSPLHLSALIWQGLYGLRCQF
jgi:hypothetical protein